MLNIKGVNILKVFAAFSLVVILTACHSSNNNPNLPIFDLTVAPQNVKVVAGDGNSSAVQNTISWTLDPAATDYVVYVGNAAGVDENSSVVIPAS